jgi:hypothetical protein
LKPTYLPDEWGIGGHLIPGPAVFLGAFPVISKRYLGSGTPPRKFLYRVLVPDEKKLFPDFLSLVDYGAYIEEDGQIYFEGKTPAALNSLENDRGFLWAGDLTWQDVFRLTKTVAYVDAIPPEFILD